MTKFLPPIAEDKDPSFNRKLAEIFEEFARNQKRLDPETEDAIYSDLESLHDS